MHLPTKVTASHKFIGNDSIHTAIHFTFRRDHSLLFSCSLCHGICNDLPHLHFLFHRIVTACQDKPVQGRKCPFIFQFVLHPIENVKWMGTMDRHIFCHLRYICLVYSTTYLALAFGIVLTLCKWHCVRCLKTRFLASPLVFFFVICGSKKYVRASHQFVPVVINTQSDVLMLSQWVLLTCVFGQGSCHNDDLAM